MTDVQPDQKLLDAPLGLLLNFHELKLVDGLHRLILPGANAASPVASAT